MKIAIPKEIKKQEYRVGLLPSVAYQMVKQGHTVLVERGAGAGTGYPDAEYEQAGATLMDDHAALFAEGDLVVKVKEPMPEEYGLMRPGQVLFTYFHLAASRELTEAVRDSGVTALAYEPIEVTGRLPLLVVLEPPGRLVAQFVGRLPGIDLATDLEFLLDPLHIVGQHESTRPGNRRVSLVQVAVGTGRIVLIDVDLGRPIDAGQFPIGAEAAIALSLIHI